MSDRGTYVNGIDPAAFMDEELDDAALDALLAGVHPEEPTRDGAEVAAEARFEDRFEDRVDDLATMLDVPRERARELLTGVDNSLAWGSEFGMATIWVDGGPAAQQAIRGFVRLEAGKTFPRHTHLGTEDILVLQGYAEMDDGRVLGPGDRIVSTEADEHSFRARPGGSDLLYFVVAEGGLSFGGFEVKHRDDS